MSEVETVRPTAEELEHVRELGTLIADLSTRFIDLAPGELDREIEAALGRVCDFLDLELAVLWQWSPALSEVIAPTHFYCSLRAAPPPGPMSQEQYPWCRGEMLAGRTVVVRSPEELPPEAAVDRATCRAFGIRSAVSLPLSIRGELPFGALGLNSLAAEREWTDLLMMHLQLLSQIFTNALARSRQERQLRSSEARLTAAADLAGLAFYEVDFATGAMFVDDRMRLLCGISPKHEQDVAVIDFWIAHLHPDDLEGVLESRRQLREGSLDRLSTEYRYLHPTLGEKWIHHLAGVAQRDASGGPVKTYGVLRDITDGKRAEIARRDLARRLIRAQEEERAMLARELHDDLTQRLAVLAIEAGRAEHVATDPVQARTMQSIREGLVRLSDDVHALASQLHPSVLEELGLAEALRAEGERLSRQGGIDLAVKIAPLPAVVGKAVALCLFRVAQESLSNVIRHSRARAASVDLQPMDGGLLLAVRDDGVGFNGEDPGKRRSLGLLSMEERVRLQNGTFDIESAPGRGTSIVAWLPAEDGET